MLKLNLLVRRFFAGALDLIFVNFFILLSLSLWPLQKGSSSSSIIAIYFVTMLLWFHTTLGGLLLKLRVVSLNEKPFGTMKVVIRSMLIGVAAIVGAAAVMISSKGSVNFLVAMIAINTLPYFFTEKNLMLHDIISRSHVEIGYGEKLDKTARWAGLAVFILVVGGYFFISAREIVKIQECEKLYKEQQYQAVIDKCAPLTRAKTNGQLNLMLGVSYYQLHKYNESIDTLIRADILGVKQAQYLRQISSLAKGDYERVINWSKNAPKNKVSMLLVSVSYAKKYLVTQDINDLVICYAYSKAATSGLVENNSDAFGDIDILSAEKTVEVEKGMNSFAEKFSPEQLRRANEMKDKIINGTF